MALVIKDRVKEGTTTTGTGDISLSGASATFSTFQSHMSNADTTYYAIVHTSSGTDEWEVGLGTWNTGNTLTRTTVLDGSNGTSKVNFGSGTKNVFMVSPADKTVLKDSSGDVTIDLTAIDDTVIGGTTAAAGTFTTLGANYVDLATDQSPSHAEGRIFYDNTNDALAVYNSESDITLQVGQEEYIRVYNDTGSTIANGTPVYITGEANDYPTIAKASAATEAAAQAVGLATHSIENATFGFVTVRGLVGDLDTSALTEGNRAHVGVTAGTIVETAPSYPYFAVDLGTVLISHASTGCMYVNVESHSFEELRVTGNARIDTDLTVGGDLTVIGTQTSTSSNNVSLGASFQYLNAGDTIGESGTTQSTGSGLDDATFTGHFTGTASKTFYVKIDGTGTPDTFSWSDDNFATTEATGVSITGSDQTLADGISIKFGATTGHTSGDIWSGTAAPANVDSGLFTNYNTGGSGTGYTHTGIFWDADQSKWTLLSEYDPEPTGTINVSHSSTVYGTLKAGTFEGDLTGDVTGALTGNANTATALATARNIGGVSFNGTANIDLPGVNTTGNQNTTGSAATLTTARTIQLTGDVTGSATFDGSANASITATVLDDSHSHVISNVDGLQTALDGKTATTRDLTAGNGLTGGGDLSANRTFAVGAGTGVTVNANDVAIGQDVATTANVTFAGVTVNGNIAVTGTVDGRDINDLHETPTITVTVAANKFVLDGTSQQTAVLGKSLTYRFDQSASTNSSHPIKFSTTSDGTHNSGTALTEGVTSVGTPGSSGAYTEITIPQDQVDTIYYYCQNHSGMGGKIYSGTDFSTLTSTITELNKLDGFTGVVADLNYAKDLRATGVTTAEFDKLDGLTATTTELNYVDGVTSNIQTQLGTKLPLAGGTMTGALRHDQNSVSASGGTLTMDLSASNNFYVTISAATTFAFSNKDAGRFGNIIIKQNATGGYSFTLPSECKTPVNGASIVQSTGANEISILAYYVLDSNNILVNYIGDFA